MFNSYVNLPEGYHSIYLTLEVTYSWYYLVLPGIDLRRRFLGISMDVLPLCLGVF